MNVIYWIWTKKGESLTKSKKSEKKNIPISKPTSLPLYNSLEESIIQQVPNSFMEENKRDLHAHRMAKRKLVTNRQINPFLMKNDYLKDIAIQDAFLRPKNSNFNIKNKDLNDD